MNFCPPIICGLAPRGVCHHVIDGSDFGKVSCVSLSSAMNDLDISILGTDAKKCWFQLVL